MIRTSRWLRRTTAMLTLGLMAGTVSAASAQETGEMAWPPAGWERAALTAPWHGALGVSDLVFQAQLEASRGASTTDVGLPPATDLVCDGIPAGPLRAEAVRQGSCGQASTAAGGVLDELRADVGVTVAPEPTTMALVAIPVLLLGLMSVARAARLW